MSKSKQKPRSLGWGRFWVLWVALAVLIHMLTRVAHGAFLRDINIVTEVAPLLLVYIPIWVLQTWGQVYLLQRLVRRSLKFWIPVSVAGWIVSFIMTHWLYNITFSTSFYELPSVVQHTIINLPTLLLPALVQWFVLRRKVERAWLWVVAALAGVLSFVGFNLVINSIQDVTLISSIWLGNTIVSSGFVGLFALWIVFLTRRRETTIHQVDDDGEDEEIDVDRLIEQETVRTEGELHPLQRQARSY